MISTPEKCAKPHSDVESARMSKAPEDRSDQKIQKKKVLHAGIRGHSDLNLNTSFPSMQKVA